jgi:AcrR family transcriptional regulator
MARSGSVRERLLEAADKLFYEEGVHAVGIDRVLETAGVAKASLYGTFGSKDNLVAAYLVGRSMRIRERVEAEIGKHDEPRAQILAVFDYLNARALEMSYRGCPFVNACGEGPSLPSAARAAAADHRRWRQDMFVRLATELGADEPGDLGKRLSLLYDGGVVGSSMDSNPDAPRMARVMAERLLDERKPRRRAK